MDTLSPYKYATYIFLHTTLHSTTHPFMHLLIHLHIYLSIYSFADPFTHLPIDLCLHSFIY